MYLGWELHIFYSLKFFGLSDRQKALQKEAKGPPNSPLHEPNFLVQFAKTLKSMYKRVVYVCKAVFVLVHICISCILNPIGECEVSL